MVHHVRLIIETQRVGVGPAGRKRFPRSGWTAVISRLEGVLLSKPLQWVVGVGDRHVVPGFVDRRRQDDIPHGSDDKTVRQVVVDHRRVHHGCFGRVDTEEIVERLLQDRLSEGLLLTPDGYTRVHSLNDVVGTNGHTGIHRARARLGFLPVHAVEWVVDGH